MLAMFGSKCVETDVFPQWLQPIDVNGSQGGYNGPGHWVDVGCPLSCFFL